MLDLEKMEIAEVNTTQTETNRAEVLETEWDGQYKTKVKIISGVLHAGQKTLSGHDITYIQTLDGKDVEKAVAGDTVELTSWRRLTQDNLPKQVVGL